jgi:K+-transporting ATPase A subunit
MVSFRSRFYYMTRVFNGERTFLSPLLRPFERVIYTVSGVNEREEQGWLAYGLAMLKDPQLIERRRTGVG